MDAVIIRHYKEVDKEQVRKISVDTAFLGKSGLAFFPDLEILADCLTGYYLEFEPQSSFIAEQGSKVVGYVLGSIDTKRCGRISSQKILPRAIFKSFYKGLFFRLRAQKFIYYLLGSFNRKEFKRPNFSLEYPAHLHINLDEKSRGIGIGTKLMESFLDYLKINGIKGVHAWTMTDGGKILFRGLGFELLYEQRVTYFDELLRTELFLDCFGRKI